MKVTFEYSENEKLVHGVSAHRIKLWINGVFYCENFAPFEDGAKYKMKGFGHALEDLGRKVRQEAELALEVLDDKS